jgi:hypothetical protein
MNIRGKLHSGRQVPANVLEELERSVIVGFTIEQRAVMEDAR